MFSRAHFPLALVLSLSLLATGPQSSQASDKVTVTGDDLVQGDGPFMVWGYNNEFAEEGVLLKDTESLEVAVQKACDYITANANKNGRAEIVAYTQDPMKRATITLKKPRKKDFKQEKKAQPIPDYKPAPFVDAEPYNPPGKAKTYDFGQIAGTYTNGQGQNKFVIDASGKVTIYAHPDYLDGGKATGTLTHVDGDNFVLSAAGRDWPVTMFKNHQIVIIYDDDTRKSTKMVALTFQTYSFSATEP
jgi:hypothetical protein